jgi:two-component system, chemotaxis family, CheB/CheR fusion protein
MTTETLSSPPPLLPQTDRALALALRLAHAENALLALTSGQVDAVVDPGGKTYLLRPAQEQLRQSERRLLAILEGAADVLTVVNRGGVILSQTAAVRRVLGYEPDELIGRRIFDFVHEEDLPLLYFAYFNVIEGFDETATVQFRHSAQDGSWPWLEATVGRLGEATSASVVFSLRRATNPLPPRPEPRVVTTPPTEAAIAKDRFLAMLAHELRTPLTPVLLGVAELDQDERLAEARPVFAMMRRNLELQSRLLEELLDFTTVGQHKVRLRPEPLDAHEHVRYVLEICRSEIAAAQLAVRLDFRATENIVLADSVRLQQVMWNLVRNAVKFSPPGSLISISTANPAPGTITLEFADHGSGIATALLPLVFDAFQQGDHSGQPLRTGLGLGLFIAKGLTEAQGGTLTAHSAGPGEGATFRLTLSGPRTSPGATNLRPD